MEDSEEDRKPTPAEKAAADAAPPSHLSESPARAVKPALKKKTGSKKPKKKIIWDEVAIEEHDLLRGTRMKIDEPNTPYTHYDSGQDSDDSRRPKSPVVQKNTLSWDSLQNRLDSVAAVRDAYPSSPSSHGGDQSDVEEERTREMRRLEFKEHRKRHYNEMELVKQFRKEHPDEMLIAAEDEHNGDDDLDGDADDEQD